MTLKQAVTEFLAAHDQYETFAKYKITYGSQKDIDMHNAEWMAIATLRKIVAKKARLKHSVSGTSSVDP